MTRSTISGRVALVTGGSGFIGTHLCAALEKENCSIHAVSRKAEPGKKGNVRYWKGDVSDLATARRILAAIRPEVIFHLAGYVSGSRAISSVLPAFRDNLTSTIHLLIAAAELGCQRIVLAGSLEEPGPDSSVATPCSPYAASKLAATSYARMFYALYGLPVVVARMFMVYGPGQADHTKLIPYVIRSFLQNHIPLISSGARLVDWIFVQDVVEGLICAAQTDGLEGDTVELGSGHVVSVRDVVERLTQMFGHDIQPEYGAIPDRPMERIRAAEVERTARQTGWFPHTSLDEGLRQTALWYAQMIENRPLIPENRSIRLRKEVHS